MSYTSQAPLANERRHHNHTKTPSMTETKPRVPGGFWGIDICDEVVTLEVFSMTS